VAWEVLKIADLVLQNIGAPEWVQQTLILVLAPALVLSIFATCLADSSGPMVYRLNASIQAKRQPHG
jgi:hypothetical protein